MANRVRIPVAEMGQELGPVIGMDQLAELVNVKLKTLYEWKKRGRLDGCFRRRGKRMLIVRERALNKLFNGPDW